MTEKSWQCACGSNVMIADTEDWEEPLCPSCYIPSPGIEPMPKKIWKKPCRLCPTYHYKPDPEAEDMKRGYSEGVLSVQDVVFTCAWRPTKLCKGICDYMGINEGLM